MKRDTRGRESLAELMPVLLVTTDLEAGQESTGITDSMAATPVQQQAASWLLRIADPACSREQLARLDAWLGRSVEHERIFSQLNLLWCQTDPSEADDRRSALEKALSLRPRVLQHFTWLLGNQTDARQLVHETYSRLLLIQRPHLVKIRFMRAYLLRIATLVAQEHARKECARIDATRTRGLLERLPERPMEAFVNQRLYGYTAVETAQKLGISTSAVRKRVACAIKHLHDALLGMRIS